MKVVLRVLGIIFICFVCFLILIWIVMNHSKRVREENSKIVDGYPTKVQEYLEEKYGTTFIINPKYKFRPSGPIPGDTDMPFVYEVNEAGEDGFVFNVYVYPESSKDKKIKEIRDNYCWKFINLKIKDYLISKMNVILPNEYKTIIIPDREITFGNNLSPESSIQDALTSAKAHRIINFYIITPPAYNEKNIGFTEENIYIILDEFYRNQMNQGVLTFYYYETETYDDYLKIDMSVIEKKIFSIDNNIKTWPVYISKKMEITLGMN